jgi:polar amino acid transport system substrate-binding protein
MDSATWSHRLIVFGGAVVLVACAITATAGLALYDLRKAMRGTTADLVVATTHALPESAAETSTPFPAVALQTTTATAPSAAADLVSLDPVWSKITRSGKIVVGMSADYPPFAYVDENFTIQGYDLELITEVGRRLGYPLEIKNMAFDGLFSALRLNEIDLAVAAIPLNKARDAYVNFSIVYYVGEDAVLAHEDSTIQVSRFDDLGGYRIGVQRGSVYETWIREAFIVPGLMRPHYLVLFDTPVEAAEGLVQDPPIVELVMLDALQAEVAERAMDVSIIARNLNPQLYALAIPTHATILQARLGEVMMEMQSDGTLSALAKRHLNADSQQPLPTPDPAGFQQTPEVCLDSMALEQDLNLADLNMTQPPQFGSNFTFQKGWRIRNTGTCTWDSDYVLTYVGSNPLNSPVGGNPVAIQGIVAAGQAYDIYVTLTTPLDAGRYQSFWMLRNSVGGYFGERIWAGFDVVAQTNSTPQPEAPQIYNFVVSPPQIQEGGCVNVYWSYGGIELVMSRLFRNGELILFDMPVNGAYSDCPGGIGMVDYRLVIDSAAAGSVAVSRYIEIVPAFQPTTTPAPSESPPMIESFFVEPGQIDQGQCVELSWVFSVTNLLEARLYRENLVIAENLGSPDSLVDCPQSSGRNEYRLVVESANSGSIERILSVIVRH